MNNEKTLNFRPVFFMRAVNGVIFRNVIPQNVTVTTLMYHSGGMVLIHSRPSIQSIKIAHMKEPGHVLNLMDGKVFKKFFNDLSVQSSMLFFFFENFGKK